MGAELIFFITTLYEKILCEKHFLLMALVYELSFHTLSEINLRQKLGNAHPVRLLALELFAWPS